MSLIQVEEKAEVTLVKCPEKIDVTVGQVLLKAAQGWVKCSPRLYVLNFAVVGELQVPAYRIFILLNQALKKNGSFLATINIPAPIGQQISAAGLESVFSPKATLDDALMSAGLKVRSTGIDRDLIEPFIQAVKVTLEVQANTKTEIGASYFRKHGEEIASEVAATISLASRRCNGTLALLFPAEVFLLIYSNLLGEKRDEITREMEDAAGELLNMIFGQAKAELNDKGDYDVQRAIPTIVRGSSVRIVHHLNRNPVLVVPYKTEAGTFFLEASLESS